MEDIKKKIVKILKKYGIKKAGIFGSYARGEQTEDSDIDILVELSSSGFSLIDFIRLKNILEDSLNKKVDLVEYSAIKSLIRKDILKEEVAIL